MPNKQLSKELKKEIENYSGDFEPIPSNLKRPNGVGVLVQERELGEMNDHEKKLFTFFFRKRKEFSKLLQTYTNTTKDPEEMESFEREKLYALIENDTDKMKIMNELSEAVFLLNTELWKSIYSRYQEPEGETIEIRPGWKIVTGIEDTISDAITKAVMEATEGLVLNQHAIREMTK